MTATSIILSVDEVRRMRLGLQTEIRRPVSRFRDPEPFRVGAAIDAKEPFALLDRKAEGKIPRTLKRRVKGLRGPTPGTVDRARWRAVYRADDEGDPTLSPGTPWFHAGQMPLTFSRLALHVVSVRRHLLQEIDSLAAEANGAPRCMSDPSLHIGDDARVCSFASEWDEYAAEVGDESVRWVENPEVWAVRVAPVFVRHG